MNHHNDRAVLYIETREEITFTVPLLLHMTQVVPPEWRFLFIATPEIIEAVNTSSPIRRMVDTGKLRLQDIERFSSKWGRKLPELPEIYSRLLTNLTFYDEQLPKVENLLVFRSSSIICANSNKTVNDYLDYDWVGAPWFVSLIPSDLRYTLAHSLCRKETDAFGGNGGLSLRKLSKTREVLSFQSRLDNLDSEDQWLSKRIGLLPGANNANASIAATFSVENVWHPKPMGYHILPGLNAGNSLQVWGQKSKRQEIFEYCPEIKIILPMRLNRERCEAIHPTHHDSADFVSQVLKVDRQRFNMSSTHHLYNPAHDLLDIGSCLFNTIQINFDSENSVATCCGKALLQSLLTPLIPRAISSQGS